MIYTIFLFLMSVIVFFFMYSKKFINPYRLYMVFGKKGSGKSTYMTRLALFYHKRGWHIMANYDCPYATRFEPKYLGRMIPPPNTVVLIDEVGCIWDNRNFKNFPDYTRDYFKFQRKYKNIVYLFSQTFDIDLKLRTLTDVMYLCTCPLPFLSIVRRIKRTIVLVQPSADAEGRIADSLEFVPWYMNLFGARAVQFTWIPKYARHFNTNEAPELPFFPLDDNGGAN